MFTDASPAVLVYIHAVVIPMVFPAIAPYRRRCCMTHLSFTRIGRGLTAGSVTLGGIRPAERFERKWHGPVLGRAVPQGADIIAFSGVV